MGVVQMRSGVEGHECIAESHPVLNRALSDERNAIGERRSQLTESMPMHCGSSPVHFVDNIDYYDVILAHLNQWTRKLPVDGEESALVAISCNALLMEALRLISLGAVVACS